MCGLCGFTGEIVDRDAVLENMTEVITHRGPDSKGFYTDDKISMGFRRLSIIDLDNGSQPIYNEDKTLVLMFNGEIYNYKQLRKELQEKGYGLRGAGSRLRGMAGGPAEPSAGNVRLCHLEPDRRVPVYRQRLFRH